MADISDVSAALVALIAQTLYPNGIGQPSVVAAPCMVYVGWPVPAQLDKDLAQGNCHVSIFPSANERNTTRYLRQWQQLPAVAPTLTLTQSGKQIEVGGAVQACNVCVLLNGDYYTYAVQPGDTLASVATALAVQIPGATNTLTVIDLNPDYVEWANNAGQSVSWENIGGTVVNLGPPATNLIFAEWQNNSGALVEWQNSTGTQINWEQNAHASPIVTVGMSAVEWQNNAGQPISWENGAGAILGFGILSDANIQAARVGGTGYMFREVRRQERMMQICIWTPTPQLRDNIAKALDAVLVDTTFLTMPDQSVAHVAYKNSPVIDDRQKACLYRRDLNYLIEYANTETVGAMQITQLTVGIGLMIDPSTSYSKNY